MYMYIYIYVFTYINMHIYIYTYVRVSDRRAIRDIPSPAWHRNLRRKRSKARARIRKIKAFGGLPSRRTLAWLSSHHSRPYSQLLSMGKSTWGKNVWKTQDYQEGDPAGGWSYWHGSWKSAQQKGQKGNPSSGGNAHGGKEAAFPAYHQMAKSTAADKAGKQAESVTDWPNKQGQEDDFVRDMQKMLNTSRKLDGRIRTCLSETEKREEQWQEFQSQLRASFVEQRQLYLTDKKKAEKELEEIREQKTELVKRIEGLVANKDTCRKPQPVQVTPTQEDITAWHDLMAPTPLRDGGDVEDDLALQQALQAAHDPRAFLQMTLKELASAELLQHGGDVDMVDTQQSVAAAAVTPPQGHVLTTPPRKAGQPMAYTPPPLQKTTKTTTQPAESMRAVRLDTEDGGNVQMYAKAVTGVGRDPYMLSPSHVAEAMQPSPAQEAPCFGPVRTLKSRAVGRHGNRAVSESPDGGHTTTLVDKLNARQRELHHQARMGEAPQAAIQLWTSRSWSSTEG